MGNGYNAGHIENRVRDIRIFSLMACLGQDALTAVEGETSRTIRLALLISAMRRS
jgi:hypothetical protein